MGDIAKSAGISETAAWVIKAKQKEKNEKDRPFNARAISRSSLGNCLLEAVTRGCGRNLGPPHMGILNSDAKCNTSAL
jgi:hypothetical protein